MALTKTFNKVKEEKILVKLQILLVLKLDKYVVKLLKFLDKEGKMKLVIENADKDLQRAIKNVVKLTDAKMTTQKEPSDRLLSAMKEVEEMEKHPEKYKSYNSVEEMFEDLNK